MKDKLRQKDAQLNDEKERYATLKHRCADLEGAARDREERARHWQAACEELKREYQGKDAKSAKPSAAAVQQFEATIADLKVQLEDSLAKTQDFTVQTELLSKNLKMEQDTSNNLLVSLDTAQSRILRLEARSEKFTKKLASRDQLVSGLERVIQDLTD